MKALSAIILAAGKGTRMKSRHAKVTFPIAEKPMIQRVVDTALKMNCEQICVVVGYQKESVIAAIDENEHLQFTEQKEQLGTGHAVLISEPAFVDKDCDVLILCGDVPLLSHKTLQKMYETHINEKAACTVLTAFLPDAGNYGRILRDKDLNVCAIVEFKDANAEQRAIREFNTGIYCFDSKEMFNALKSISNTNTQGEYYLTDVLQIMYEGGKRVSSVVLEDIMEVSGVNSQEQLAILEVSFLDSIKKHWLNNGVIMHNPSSIYIGDDVVLEPDVEIWQNTIIKGKTIIQSGAIIGPNCIVEDSHISSNSVLKGNNVVLNAYIAEHLEIPYYEELDES